MKILVLMLLFLPAAAGAQMYKCVDERGVTHYSDKPRPGCKGAEVGIGSSPLGNDGSGPARELRSEEAQFQRRRIEREQAEEKAAATRAALERRCASLHAQFQRLTNAGRLFTVDAKGERKAVDDATRAARLANLKAEIDRQCR